MSGTHLTARSNFGNTFPFGRLSPFFIDVPALSDALKEVDRAMEIFDTDGRQLQRETAPRAILLDVKEVR
jgi:hypothetical protein